VSDCPIPASLIQGEKIQLRNNMIYWDAETRSIWLRPRGMNLLKAPFTAGRLSTDPNGASKIGTEILLSSALPFVAILDLVAYWMVPATASTGASEPLAAAPVGIVVVISLVVSFIYLRTLWSRMAQLIDDALSEIRQM